MNAKDTDTVKRFVKAVGYSVWHYVQYIVAIVLMDVFLLLGVRYAQDLSLKTFFWMFLACGGATILISIFAYKYISTANSPEFRYIRKNPALSIKCWVRTFVPPKNIRTRHRWLMPLWVVGLVSVPVLMIILWIRIAALAN